MRKIWLVGGAILTLAGLLYAAVGGQVVFNLNAGNELGSSVPTGNSGGAGYGFYHMLRGPGSANVGQTWYSAMGDGDIEVTVSTTNENVMLSPYYTPGTASNFWVKVISNSLTLGATVQVRIAGANGNEVVYIPAGQTGEFKGTGLTDVIHSGNAVDVAVMAPTSGSGNIAVFNAGFVFTPVTNNMMKFVGAGNLSSPNGFAIYYNGISGTNVLSDQTETNGPQTILPLAGTLANMCVSVGTNTLNITQTMKMRHNGADGNMVISIPPNFSGILCDTTHTDTIVAGDTVDYYYNMGGTGNTGATTIWWMSSEFITTGKSTVYLEQNVSHTLAVALTQYSAIQGAESWDLESAMRILTQVPGTFSNMAVHVSANTDAINVPINFRNNGLNGAESLVIPAGQTGYYVCNSTQTDTVGANDEADTKITTDANSFAVDYYSWIFTHQ